MLTAFRNEIAKQQAAVKDSPAFYVGEQLKDIVGEDLQAAQIVLTDLQQTGMGIADCEKKIAQAAKKNKKGNCGFCSLEEAEQIICAFYGIGAPSREPAPPAPTTATEPAKPKTVSLFDFM